MIALSAREYVLAFISVADRDNGWMPSLSMRLRVYLPPDPLD